MSRLPSLQNVLNATQKTILRFPLETITAICGTIFAILNIRQDYSSYENFYLKGVMSCSLCLVWFVSASLFFAVKQKNRIIRFIVSLVFCLPLIALVFNFGEKISDAESQQFFVLNLALHLLVSFAGFIPRAYNQEEFWEFNKQLFLRILTSGLYSIVLYTGLALAILAVDQLFKVEFESKIYGYLFFLIAGIFNTIFFLSGVPDTNNKEFPLHLNYPKGLKNFTQFVLLPLITIYLAILICYETKILITLSLPVGWVSYLVLAFAIVGILSFLLVHPIADESGNLWMRTFNRWFYFLLIPLLVLLFWAILYRINLYGFTHERYYVLLLSIWLAVVVAYFLISKHPKIKFIPVSMCLAGLFSIIGPQSADSVSKYSQLSRFEDYLQKAEGKKLTFEQEKELSSVVYFLDRNYTFEIMVPYAPKKLEPLYKKDKDPGSTKIMESLGFQYRSEYEQKTKENDSFSYYYYENDNNVVTNIHDYDFTFILNQHGVFECKECITLNNTKYSIKSKTTHYGQELQINNDIIPLKINDFINTNSTFRNSYNSDQKAQQKIETSKYIILLDYLSANGKIENNKKSPKNYQIKVMAGIKNQ
ncbi:hypothetical protein L1276_002023 [Flavobacterium sp. HSC-32F16]|uniref:DUF4153 domain-containing protein n=1 Tax=Flavobacterium sp. HSC-32F16 TaxID=2910964 RepID=UPI0020A28CD9|nr:DUF4153 domain-containing protein [Flavobacterium sp. HSC-32F16]MCP2026879.1 hypothetical protein [Flavobacterium sp. HSC-32F16]